MSEQMQVHIKSEMDQLKAKLKMQLKNAQR